MHRSLCRSFWSWLRLAGELGVQLLAHVEMSKESAYGWVIWKGLCYLANKNNSLFKFGKQKLATTKKKVWRPALHQIQDCGHSRSSTASTTKSFLRFSQSAWQGDAALFKPWPAPEVHQGCRRCLRLGRLGSCLFSLHKCDIRFLSLLIWHNDT